MTNRVKYWFRFSRLLLVIVLYDLTALGIVKAQATFPEVVVFGDSLSDTGNVAGAITPNLPPPYFSNRISNGPLAIDYFVEAMNSNAQAAAQGGLNYAVVGGNIKGNDFEDLSAQIDRYLGAVGGIANSQALYFVMLGGNDLRDLTNQLDSQLASTLAKQLVGELMGQLDRLYVAGARKYLVVTTPDVGQIPQTLALEVSKPGISARASRYVETYNSALIESLVDFSVLDKVELYDFDINVSFNLMLTQPAMFGFEETRVGCFDPDEFKFQSACESILFPFVEPDFDKFVFFDSIHPTTKAHQIVGEAMVQRLLASPLKPRNEVSIAPLILLLLGN
jgi:phospholipase/lecithinase/hemolysin